MSQSCSVQHLDQTNRPTYLISIAVIHTQRGSIVNVGLWSVSLHTDIGHLLPCVSDSGLLQKVTSVYSEWFKDNLPGLGEPSAPAIPNCSGGVSINTEQAGWQAVQWKGTQRFALNGSLILLFTSMTYLVQNVDPLLHSWKLLVDNGTKRSHSRHKFVGQ